MNKKGFTLVELLVVIVILGLIMIVVATTAFPAMNKAKLNSLETYTLRLVEKAKERCISDSCTDGTEYTVEELMGENATKGYIGVLIMSDAGKDYKVSGTITTKDNKFLADVVNSKVSVKENIGSFAEDDWKTIIANVKAGSLSKYNVGDTKEIALTGFTNKEENSNGLYTIRIANKSTPKECSASGFSQTACGFVIEFEDIIITEKMNSSATNVGGWKTSKMRTYVNDEIYNALPTVLKEAIINTIVVSGHGLTSEETNFTTTDKVYLLASQEVWGSNLKYDTANAFTRQLDYYKNKGVTSTNYSDVIKKIDGNVKRWWMRSAYSLYADGFYFAKENGSVTAIAAHSVEGVSPAFRIG